MVVIMQKKSKLLQAIFAGEIFSIARGLEKSEKKNLLKIL